MTCYVDPLASNGWVMRGRLTKNCHLFTDGPIEELHALAKKIGMKREWFQIDSTIPHYDLSPARRRLAITEGAQEVGRRQAVNLWRTARGSSEFKFLRR